MSRTTYAWKHIYKKKVELFTNTTTCRGSIQVCLQMEHSPQLQQNWVWSLSWQYVIPPLIRPLPTLVCWSRFLFTNCPSICELIHCVCIVFHNIISSLMIVELRKMFYMSTFFLCLEYWDQLGLQYKLYYTTQLAKQNFHRPGMFRLWHWLKSQMGQNLKSNLLPWTYFFA